MYGSSEAIVQSWRMSRRRSWEEMRRWIFALSKRVENALPPSTPSARSGVCLRTDVRSFCRDFRLSFVGIYVTRRAASSVGSNFLSAANDSHAETDILFPPFHYVQSRIAWDSSPKPKTFFRMDPSADNASPFRNSSDPWCPNPIPPSGPTQEPGDNMIS